MTKRIFRTSFAVGVGVMVLSIALFLGVLYQHFQAQLLESLASESLLAARGVEAMGADYLEGLQSQCRFTWIAEDGTVLYDSAADAAALGNHADREEFQSALSSRSGTSIRYSSTLSQRTLYFARRLEDGSVLRLSSAQQTAITLLWSMGGSIFGILALAVALSYFLARRLSRQISMPILSLDLEHPEKAETYDELSPLLTRLKRQNDTIARQMEQLQRRQAEFTAITENMSEGFLLLDRQGHILSFNSAALSLLRSDTPGKNSSYLTLNRSEPFRKAVEQSLHGRAGQQLLHIENYCCQILANPVTVEEQVMGVVLVILDVTERERQEDLQREFTANVSHELRTPLTSISGIAEIMKNGFVQPEDVPGFAADIYNEAQRLISLVQDIINLSHLDEGAPTAERQQVDLLELSRAVAHRLLPAAGAARVALRVQGESACVWGVRRILEEMLYNLCENAIKYNRPEGSVSICIQTTARGAELTVSDTGIGIPREAQSRIFERFYRVDKSHSRAIGGTGLGLSIVKQGAVFHDAQIELESQTDVGTTFRLIFPKK